MLNVLNTERYYKIKTIISKEYANIEIKAVLEGNNPGKVFVGDIESPNCALVWVDSVEGYYFIGKPDSLDFLQRVRCFISGLPNSSGKFEFSGDSEAWDASLEYFFAEHGLTKSMQCVYHQNNSFWEYANLRLGKKFILKEIDEQFLTNSRLENVGALNQELLRRWGKYHHYFHADSIGYCVVNQEINKIVCYCLAGFEHENCVSLGVKTCENFKRMGLADCTVNAVLKKCSNLNKKVYWDCMETNIASRRLAEKHKLELAYKYSLYRLA